MSRDQLVFGAMFEDQLFCPKNGFEFRKWQSECGDTYAESVTRFRASFGVAQQHRFTVSAGTGSGKTKAVGGLAGWLLNAGLARQVVFVCPNRAIRRKTAKDLRHCWNIHLTGFHKKYGEQGIPRGFQGYILTYAHLMQDPSLHRRICSFDPTLVIFDEIHHLGDNGTWGDTAREAFDNVPFVIGLSGTPYRSDNKRIPFVAYEENSDNAEILHFKADYTYSLGRAINDGVCRLPLFVWHPGKVRIWPGEGLGEIEVTFEDTNVSEVVSRQRLLGAVTYGSETRKNMLATALPRCRKEKRKVIIFLGGDTKGDQTPTEDAKRDLPSQLQELGYTSADYEIVTGDDKESHKKIDEFGKSDKWILISINMVSEGVDIPELSAAIFLSSITAKQTTVQRIGRVLRVNGPDDPHVDALIFMFGDANWKQLEGEIRTQIDHEIDLGKSARKPKEETESDSPHKARSMAIGIEGGYMGSMQTNGIEVPCDGPRYESAVEYLRSKNLPLTLLSIYMQLTMKEGN